MKNNNKFEVGKFYKSNDSVFYIAVRGEINTTIWGNVFVAESTNEEFNLFPISKEKLTEDFEEIEEEEWLKQFTEESKNELEKG